MQHHDTITGTSKAYVINNHVFKIEKVLAGNSQMLSITVKKRLEGLFPNLQLKSTPIHVYDFDKMMSLSPKTPGPTSSEILLILHNPSLQVVPSVTLLFSQADASRISLSQWDGLKNMKIDEDYSVTCYVDHREEQRCEVEMVLGLLPWEQRVVRISLASKGAESAFL